jgi:hypothetical protein
MRHRLNFDDDALLFGVKRRSMPILRIPTAVSVNEVKVARFTGRR